MKSSRAKKNSQILFWVLSALVALSMILGTILTVVDFSPREQPAPTQRPATATIALPTATPASKPVPATLVPPSAATPTKTS